MFSIVTKLTDMNDPVAFLCHAFDSNLGTQVLPTCRGSHLCAWVAGLRVIAAITFMVVIFLWKCCCWPKWVLAR